MSHTATLSQYPIFFVSNSLLRKLKGFIITPTQLQHALYLIGETYYIERKETYPFHELFVAGPRGPVMTPVALHLLASARRPVTHYLSLDGRNFFVSAKDAYMNALILRVARVVAHMSEEDLEKAVKSKGSGWARALEAESSTIEYEHFPKKSLLSKLDTKLRKESAPLQLRRTKVTT